MYSQLIAARGGLSEDLRHEHPLLGRGGLHRTPEVFSFGLQSSGPREDSGGALSSSPSFLTLLLTGCILMATCVWITLAMVQVRRANRLRAQALQDLSAKRAAQAFTVPVVVIQPDDSMHLGAKVPPADCKDTGPPARQAPSTPVSTKGCCDMGGPGP